MPAFLGIPVLISFLSGVIGAVITQIISSLTRQTAKTIFIASLFLALVVLFIRGAILLFDSVVVFLPPQITDVISLIMPENTLFCISAVSGLKVAVFTFDVKDRIIKYMAS
ncbi:TPA: DUF5455 family protein [Morganella morganii]|nr:DUF5455 family protein [Morganella morganii]